MALPPHDGKEDKSQRGEHGGYDLLVREDTEMNGIVVASKKLDAEAKKAVNDKVNGHKKSFEGAPDLAQEQQEETDS